MSINLKEDDDVEKNENSFLVSFFVFDFLPNFQQPAIEQKLSLSHPLVNQISDNPPPWFHPLPPGSVQGSVFQLISETLGGSSVALSFAFLACGAVFGSLALAGGCLLACFSMRLLVQCRDLTNTDSYEALARHAFGRWFEIFVELNIFLLTWGSVVAYSVVMGDTLPSLVVALFSHDDDASASSSFWLSREFLMCLFTVVLVFPLSLLRNLSSLRYTSLMGFLSVLYLIVSVTVRSAGVLRSHHGLPDWRDPARAKYLLFNTTSQLAFGVPIFLFAFSSHVNVFSIYRELQKPTPQRMNAVIGITVVLALLLYLMIGLFGFFNFLDATPDNILCAYPTDDVLMQIASLAVTLTLILNIPLNCHPCRHTIDVALCSASERFANLPLNLRHVAETVTIIFSALAVAIIFPQVSTIFGLLGATTISLVCYVLPSFIWLRVNRLHFWSPRALGPTLIAAVGILVGALSTFFIIRDLITNGISHNGCPKPMHSQ